MTSHYNMYVTVSEAQIRLVSEDRSKTVSADFIQGKEFYKHLQSHLLCFVYNLCCLSEKI